MNPQEESAATPATPAAPATPVTSPAARIAVDASLESLARELMRDRRLERRWRVFFRLAWLGLVVAAVWALVMQRGHSGVPSGPHTALVEVRGEIAAETEASAELLIAALKQAFENSGAVGVVIRINSPGGTVTASDILYHELREFKIKKKIPVVISMMDVAASGGYYLAMAGDSILVHPSTVTGSIGVIMLTVNARGLLEKVGVEANAITSGPRKDMGSPFRVMTPEERGIFQSVIDSFYQRFLTVVQEGRPHLSAEQIKKLADGRIYSGDQAKAAGLIDEIGYLDDAIELAKKKAGLTEARVVTYGRRGEYQNNIYSRLFGTSSGITGLANLDLLTMVRGGTPQFMYLWMP